MISPRFPYRGFLFDLDGTVYLGERLLPGAREAIAALRAEARPVCFLSNKPIQSRADYAAKLTRLGVPTGLDEVINSSYVLAQHLAREAPGARCFVIGEPPLVEELRAAGLAPVDDARVDYVVVAFDRTFDYRKLDVALQAVTRHGARLVGTNPDRTCPIEEGEIPDAAGMIGAVEGVTGRRVDPVVGKPSPIMLRVALDRLGLPAPECAIVGDRLETDIAMGRAAGLGTILVLTGITRPGDPEIARWRPDHVVGSLAELLEGVAAPGEARPVSRVAGLDRELFDAIVVGGGMAGAGIARDLAQRGLSAVLVEKTDFAAGTTSRSSKLIHGGLRYLELFDFQLVRESLRERETLARLAPQLLRPLPFLMPVYREGPRSLIKVRLGLRLYDLLTPGKRTPRYGTMSAARAQALEPALRPDGLLGAGYYFDDLLLSPERLCLENVLSARRAGAHGLNYAQAEEFTRRPDGDWTVRVRDLVGGDVAELHGRVLVNATGPWVDRIRARAGVEDRGERILRTTKGAHVLLPRITERAVYLATEDDRLVFVIPWREFSLVGTTDTDYTDSPDRVWATKADVQYLLEAARRLLADPRITEANVAYAYAGVRPLTFDGTAGKRASAVSRQHRVVAEGPGGRFLSITGTKLTCFRSLAERVGATIARLLGRGGPSDTARIALDGEDEEAGALEVRAMLDVTEAVRSSGLEREQIEMLVSTYGRRARAVLDAARRLPGGTERLCKNAPEIAAQLNWAVESELAVSLQDLLLRRTGIGTGPCLGLDCAPAIAQRMGALLGWSPRRLEAELDAYEGAVRQGLRFRSE